MPALIGQRRPARRTRAACARNARSRLRPRRAAADLAQPEHVAERLPGGGGVLLGLGGGRLDRRVARPGQRGLRVGDAEPDVGDTDAVAAGLDGRADGLAALGQLAHGDPGPLGDAVAGEDRRAVGRVVVLGIHLQPGRLHVGLRTPWSFSAASDPLHGGAGAGRAPRRGRAACR